MPLIRERTVLFADLRGSTALYESLGNALATSLVTRTVAQISEVVPRCKGLVIKTLGDGLMAVFAEPRDGLKAAIMMHEALNRMLSRDRQSDASPGYDRLRLQVALACGEVVELAGDCFGDAVNVAARLIGHAGDNETLITADVLGGLAAQQRRRFRSLDRIALRGRTEPIHVFVLDSFKTGDLAPTQFGEVVRTGEPDGIRLTWMDLDRVFDAAALPLVLGRSVQATFCITDVRVSRSHARIDWNGNTFSLTDLSYNGTYVRFGGDAEIISLRRGTCTLHGSGVIGLGSPPLDAATPAVRFEALRFDDTLPGHHLIDRHDL